MKTALKSYNEIGPGGIKFQLKPRGDFFQLSYSNPRTHRQTRVMTGTNIVADARAFAAEHIQKYALDNHDPAKVTVGDLVKARLLDIEGTRNHREVSRTWARRLAPIFGHVLAQDLRTPDIRNYKAWARGQVINTGLFQGIPPYPRKLSKGTIQRDLANLSKAFNFGIKGGVIDTKPCFEKYPKSELGMRIGEVSLEEFQAVMEQQMPTWLRCYLQISWDCGNRAGEPKKLRVHQFDGLGIQLAPGHERQDVATEKNGQGRWFPLSVEGIHLVKGMVSGKKGDELIFTREDRNLGERGLGDFRKLWRTILDQAGIERHVLLHDFRRTAVSNLHDAGVDGKLIQEIVGHKDEKMNRQYRQTGRTRLIAAMRKKEAWEKAQLGQVEAPDQLAELHKQIAEGKAREAQMQAALTALQQAITNLSQPGRETVATLATQEMIQ